MKYVSQWVLVFKYVCVCVQHALLRTRITNVTRTGLYANEWHGGTERQCLAQSQNVAAVVFASVITAYSLNRVSTLYNSNCWPWYCGATQTRLLEQSWLKLTVFTHIRHGNPTVVVIVMSNTCCWCVVLVCSEFCCNCYRCACSWIEVYASVSSGCVVWIYCVEAKKAGRSLLESNEKCKL